MSEKMNTGEIGRALGLIVPVETMEAAGLTQCGRNKRAILWEEDWSTICESLGAYITAQASKRPAAPPPPKPRAKKEAAPKQADLPINGDGEWEDEDDL